MDSSSNDRGCNSDDISEFWSSGSEEKFASNGSEDRISFLPDAIRVKILSFLPTVESVRTATLACKWKHIWKSVANLQFDLNEIQCWFSSSQAADVHVVSNVQNMREEELELERLKNAQIINFGNRILACFQGVNVRRVSLLYTKFYYGNIYYWKDVINVWISIFVNRGAEEFDLRVNFGEVVQLPPCLFTNESIEVLKLNLNGCRFELPSTMGFTMIKRMHLTSVVFFDENLTKQLFSGCPVLEELILKKCGHHRDFKVVAISSLSLKSLVIKIGKRCICNKVLSFKNDLNNICGCELKLSSPELEFFTYKGCAAKDYIIDELPSIKSANICSFSTVSNSEPVAKLWSKVLDGLHMVQVLKICGVCIKEENPKPIKKPSDEEENGEEYMRLLKMFSGRKLQNLRKIEMTEIIGELELDFLKLMLQTQVFLEGVILEVSYTHKKCSWNIADKLLALPRASPNLALVFVLD